MSTEPGAKVLEYANKKRGTIVRRKGRPKNQEAQCWDLPEEALDRAGAKTSWMHFQEQRKAGKAGADDFGKDNYEYVWGKPVEIGSSMAGDIIQFRDHKQKYEANFDFTVGKGREVFNCSDDIRVETRGPQHSAIVLKRLASGWVAVLEQHVRRPKPARSTVTGRGTVFLKPGQFETVENDTISGKWVSRMKRRMVSKDCRNLVDRIAKNFSGPVRVRIRAQAKTSGIATIYRPQKR